MSQSKNNSLFDLMLQYTQKEKSGQKTEEDDEELLDAINLSERPKTTWEKMQEKRELEQEIAIREGAEKSKKKAKRIREQLAREHLESQRIQKIESPSKFLEWKILDGPKEVVEGFMKSGGQKAFEIRRGTVNYCMYPSDFVKSKSKDLRGYFTSLDMNGLKKKADKIIKELP